MPDMTLEYLKQSLDTMTQVLRSHMGLVNTCMVEFIVKDMFSLLPLNIQSELLSLSDDLLVSLPSLLFEDSPWSEEKMRMCPELMAMVTNLRECRMESLGIVSEDIISREEENVSGLEHWDKIMAEKKTHEVDRMSRFVKKLVTQHNISCLVDLGSGKAYLSQVISSMYNIPVLAIDGKQTNTEGAQKREKKLQSKWDGLASRAAERAAGEMPTNRKSRLKKNENKKQKKEEEDRSSSSSLVTVTKYVESGSDISDLVQTEMGLR